MKKRKTQGNRQFLYGVGGVLLVVMLLNAEFLSYRLEWASDWLRSIAGRLETMQTE